MWYTYAENDEIRSKASSVLDHMNKSRWSRAHDECVELVLAAVDAGLRACFVIDRIQFLDSFSMSIMRGCLEGKSASGIGENQDRPRIVRLASERDLDDGAWSDCSSSGHTIRGKEFRKGKVVFLGCHLSLCKSLFSWYIAWYLLHKPLTLFLAWLSEFSQITAKRQKRYKKT